MSIIANLAIETNQKKKKVQAAPTKSETKIPLQTDYTEYKHTTSRLATRELN